MATSDVMELYYLYMVIAVMLGTYLLVKCWAINDYENPKKFNDCYEKFVNLVFTSMIASICLIVYLVFLK